MLDALGRPVRYIGQNVSTVAARLRPNAASEPPWKRSILDDIATRRPWNVVAKAVRVCARLRVRRLRDGVTVVIVSWNTREVLADVLRAVQALSPPDTEILVIDNRSNDGSRSMLREWPGIRTMLLPANVGHGLALDLGVYRSRTTVTVTLDSDAIPLTSTWLESAVDPVRSGRAVLAGLRSRRGFVHPVYSAVDTKQFVDSNLSFQVHRPPLADGVERVWGQNAWDTAELLTPRLEPGQVAFVEPTANRADGLPGMTVGDVVYHHGGVSRDSSGGITREALAGWRDACLASGVDSSTLGPMEQSAT